MIPSLLLALLFPFSSTSFIPVPPSLKPKLYIIPASYKTPLHSSTPQPSYHADCDKKHEDKALATKKAIHLLYPPTTLESRNARSRTDGYWKYIAKNEDPPLHFTYGEFDLEFFGDLLDIVRERYLCIQDPKEGGGDSDNLDNFHDKVFLDVGSGTGRLVLTAAALYSWKECRGIEILEGIHQMAVEILDGLPLSGENEIYLGGAVAEENSVGDASTTTASLPLAPIRFMNGSFDDVKISALENVDVAFAFSSCWSKDLFREFGKAVARQCRPGTIIITTEYPLEELEGEIYPIEENAADDETQQEKQSFQFELLESINGSNEITGGLSTAYIHRVKKSLYNSDYKKNNAREKTLQEDAYELVMKLERGELTDEAQFLRNIHNDMVFSDMPKNWRPKLT